MSCCEVEKSSEARIKAVHATGAARALELGVANLVSLSGAPEAACGYGPWGRTTAVMEWLFVCLFQGFGSY